MKSIICHQLNKSRPQGYKTFFMLNSAEHEILSANKYENANNSFSEQIASGEVQDHWSSGIFLKLSVCADTLNYRLK